MKRPMILIYCIVFVCLFCKLIHVISSLHSCEERLREVFTASFFNGFSYLLPSSLYPSSFFNGFFPPPTHLSSFLSSPFHTPLLLLLFLHSFFAFRLLFSCKMELMVSLLFDRQQPLAYVIEGDGQAPEYFDINSTTGEVFLKKDLTDDQLKASTYTVSPL